MAEFFKTGLAKIKTHFTIIKNKIRPKAERKTPYMQ